MTVTRRDLAQALKEEHGGTISGHDEWIKKFIDVLSRKISESGRVEIRGFGTFNLNSVRAHTTINPGVETPEGQEPERIEVPETYTVDFRPSGSYKERLRAERKPRAKAKSPKKKPKRKKSSKKRSKKAKK